MNLNESEQSCFTEFGPVKNEEANCCWSAECKKLANHYK